jgi:hypothetical protein
MQGEATTYRQEKNRRGIFCLRPCQASVSSGDQYKNRRRDTLVILDDELITEGTPGGKTVFRCIDILPLYDVVVQATCDGTAKTGP